MGEHSYDDEGAGGTLALYVILTILLVILVGAVLWFGLGQQAQLAPGPIVAGPMEPAPPPSHALPFRTPGADGPTTS